MNRDGVAYKILGEEAWRAALDAGVFRGSEVDQRDGYIHLSTGAQLAETAARHYAGQAALRLLTVDLGRLGDSVVWEPSRGGQLFPHIHGDLPVGAVIEDRALAVSEDGAMSIGPVAASA